MSLNSFVNEPVKSSHVHGVSLFVVELILFLPMVPKYAISHIAWYDCNIKWCRHFWMVDKMGWFVPRTKTENCRPGNNERTIINASLPTWTKHVILGVRPIFAVRISSMFPITSPIVAACSLFRADGLTLVTTHTWPVLSKSCFWQGLNVCKHF